MKALIRIKIKDRSSVITAMLVIILLINTPVYSQFNKLIFKKQLNFNTIDFRVYHNPIQQLGDQNKDGYGDFLLYDCKEQKSYIYFGGNPVDTLPDLIISGGVISINLLDINNDNQKDIVFLSNESYPNRKIKIYYGGSLLDTIPDIVFSPPPGAMNNFGYISTVLKDFDGDGRSELVYFNPDLPFTSTGKQYGCVYIYNTESTFDTIPHYSFFGDSVQKIALYDIDSRGDINGDGLTDFTIWGAKTISVDTIIRFRNFYLGNTVWNLAPVVTYFKNEHKFDPQGIHIVNDLNKDGKDDMIIYDYGFYPYYYYNAVLKGNYPIDTIPAWGLNTQNMGIYTYGVIDLGDVNGDGFNDFMSATATFPHNIKMWLGGRRIHTEADKTWFGTDPGGFCSGYGAAGDINGDGVNDIAIWEKPYGSSNDCDVSRIYIFAGDTSAKADTILTITDKEKDIPSEYRLNEPYPNPFNPSVVISWYTPVKSSIKIKVYDVLGKEIAILLDEESGAGENKIEFDAGKYKLTSGIYLLQLECYSQGKLTYKETKKLSFIK